MSTILVRQLALAFLALLDKGAAQTVLTQHRDPPVENQKSVYGVNGFPAENGIPPGWGEIRTEDLKDAL